jgi:hypothetical protein
MPCIKVRTRLLLLYSKVAAVVVEIVKVVVVVVGGGAAGAGAVHIWVDGTFLQKISTYTLQFIQNKIIIYIKNSQHCAHCCL